MIYVWKDELHVYSSYNKGSCMLELIEDTQPLYIITICICVFYTVGNV